MMGSPDFGPNTSDEGKAMRFNTGKVPLSHVLDFPRAAACMARVSEYGAKKYDRGNFQKGQKATVTLDCMLRHLWKWWCGEDIDPESGCHHLGHFLWNAMCLVEDMMRDDPDLDDRTFKRDDLDTPDLPTTYGS